MNNYKICKRCGAHNPIDEAMCIECMGIDFIFPDEDNKNEEFKTEEVEEKTFIDTTNNELTNLEKTKTLYIIINNQEYLIKNNTIVGRENFLKNILQNYKTVSRNHAKFIFDGENWYIQDLDSTNGTYVNNQKINYKELLNDDIIQLSTKFEFKIKIIEIK